MLIKHLLKKELMLNSFYHSPCVTQEAFSDHGLHTSWIYSQTWCFPPPSASRLGPACESVCSPVDHAFPETRGFMWIIILSPELDRKAWCMAMVTGDFLKVQVCVQDSWPILKWMTCYGANGGCSKREKHPKRRIKFPCAHLLYLYTINFMTIKNFS